MNDLTCSIPYFKDEYPNNANSVAFYLTAACSYSQAPLLLAMVWLGDRLPLNVRVISALAVSAGCMAALPLLAKTGMWTTLALSFVSSVCTAVLQSSLFGLARCVTRYSRTEREADKAGQLIFC